jgi:hypothetical protein
MQYPNIKQKVTDIPADYTLQRIYMQRNLEINFSTRFSIYQLY